MKSSVIPTEQLEKYSSAISLSDMEIFIFPELLYGLLLANIMSPRIWAWRNDPWFEKIDSMSPMKKVNRLKQFIIDRYEFNLDLDTWGLTTQDSELERFAPYMDRETIGKSNALFGYQGDQHYFSLDIRRHFGLEKYDDSVIPFWKTETVEAMDAFARIDGYRVGAGECVSLSTLYAAALFIICKVPIEDIFLMATPLHSQNFISYGSGFLTNNRRIVTKNMWFNGTQLTDKAQRALRNEQISMVFNNTGYVHTVYPNATMAKSHYDRFKKTMNSFLSTDITFEILGNFLRQHDRFQKCFQICEEHHGKTRWIPAERAYAYEQGSPFKVSDNTRKKLLANIDVDEFYCTPLDDRICLPKLEKFFKNNPIKLFDKESMIELGAKFDCSSELKDELMTELAEFVHLEPKFPAFEEKTLTPWNPLELKAEMTRDEVIAYLESMREHNPSADLAFYALRDLSKTDWMPFMKAALERNPVCIEGTESLSDDELVAKLQEMTNESIYDDSRVAQPDELWNFQVGDGVEKAVTLATIWRSRHSDDALHLSVTPDNATLTFGDRTASFASTKGLTHELDL